MKKPLGKWMQIDTGDRRTLLKLLRALDGGTNIEMWFRQASDSEKRKRKASEWRALYEDWCEDHQQQPIQAKEFPHQLTLLGFREQRLSGAIYKAPPGVRLNRRRKPQTESVFD